MAKQLSHLIASVVIRRGHEVLLVRQQGPDDPGPSWALPGGRVESGEVPVPGSQATALVFAVAEWSGELLSADPDGFVSECRFVPLPEAVRLLETTLPPAVNRRGASKFP